MVIAGNGERGEMVWTPWPRMAKLIVFVPPVSVLFAGPGSDTGAGVARSFISLAQHPMRVTTTELDAGNWPLAHVLDWVAAAVGAPGSRGLAGAAR